MKNIAQESKQPELTESYNEQQTGRIVIDSGVQVFQARRGQVHEPPGDTPSKFPGGGGGAKKNARNEKKK